MFKSSSVLGESSLIYSMFKQNTATEQLLLSNLQVDVISCNVIDTQNHAKRSYLEGKKKGQREL